MRLIDADVLLEPIYDCAIAVEDGDSIELRDCGKCPCNILDCEDFEKVINAAPTIEPVKVGRWAPHPLDPDWYVCTVCRLGTKRREHGTDESGREWVVEYGYQFCPRCGAKMELPEPYEEARL